MVGHLLHYHPAISTLKQLIQEDHLGQIQYIYANRLNFGKFRREENSLWSFAPHDISVILGLLQASPVNVSAHGSNHLSPHLADVTLSHLHFANGVDAHIFVSWLHPYKDHKLVIMGSEQMAVFDDTQPWSHKLTLYPHQVVWQHLEPIAQKAQANPIPLTPSEPLKSVGR